MWRTPLPLTHSRYVTYRTSLYMYRKFCEHMLGLRYMVIYLLCRHVYINCICDISCIALHHWYKPFMCFVPCRPVVCRPVLSGYGPFNTCMLLAQNVSQTSLFRLASTNLKHPSMEFPRSDDDYGVKLT